MPLGFVDGLELGWGHLDPDNVSTVSLTATAAKVELDPGATYMMVGTEAFHFRWGLTGETATTSDMFIPGLTPIIQKAGKADVFLHAIRSDSDGTLYVGKLIKAGDAA